MRVYVTGASGFVGSHVVDARGSDPEAAAFFRERGLEALCPAVRLYRAR